MSETATAEAPSRREMMRGRLLDKVPKGGTAAEIGVWEGQFSRRILEICAPDRLHLIDERSHDCIEAADAVAVASGTATLETMLFKRPMVIAYKVPRLTELITLRQALIPYIGLPNVLEGRYTVPELLQERVTPARIAHELRCFLENPAAVAQLRERFERQHERLLRDTPALVAQTIADNLVQAPR